MVIIYPEVKQNGYWEVESLEEFLNEFDLFDKALEHYGVNKIEDIYESSEFLSDDDEITEWLDNISDRKFMLDYNNDGEYWIIQEITGEWLE